MPSSTAWPLRQALALCLRSMIAGDTLTAINDDIAARMIVSAGGSPVSFGDANLVVGTPFGCSDPTIAIDVSREVLTPVASDAYLAQFETMISLKLPSAGDNAPEDFALVADIVLDNLRDLLTRATTFTLQPTDPDGHAVLPIGAKFTACRVLRIVRDNPSNDATGVASVRSWTLWHNADITFGAVR